MLFYGIFSGRIAGFFRGDGSEKGGSGFFKRILGGLNFVDWAMLAFWGANVISWILCVDWRWDAFWGTFGRYNGVFLITLYTVVYFLVTRFFRFRQWYLDLFLVTGMLVCGFGITDYFRWICSTLRQSFRRTSMPPLYPPLETLIRTPFMWARYWQCP